MNVVVITEPGFLSGGKSIISHLVGPGLDVTGFSGTDPVEELAESIAEIKPDIIILETNGRMDTEGLILNLDAYEDRSPIIVFAYLEGAYREVLEYRKNALWVQRTDSLERDIPEIIKMIEEIKK